ncbi:uncharacterized protein LOC128027405 [Carassius gibelio]|uniref:uncharacterized protein LOC128027405 n=1 Tax=Carassius gibelio TaxID=101364 RepID=UPI002277923C|nr:uncharacterized protein LOC128027405 [Carassius gibelio]
MADSNEEETTPVKDMRETVAQLRSSRGGKMSHVTRRMNIVNDLMIEPEFLDEVKQNMIKFNEFLEEFKVVHASYSEMLDEEAKQEDHESWYQPRYVQIMAFMANVEKWMSAIENPGSQALVEDSSSVTQVEDSDIDAQSFRSHTSSVSLRISAEAERVALIAKAAKLQERHAIEEQEHILRKKRESLELHSEIEATTAKINYLKEAEIEMYKPAQSDITVQIPLLGAEADEVKTKSMDEKFDSSLYLHDRTSPVVRTRPGVQVQPPLLNLGPDRYHSRPVFQPRASSDIRPQLQQTSAHSIPPVISQSLASSVPAIQSTVSQWQIPTPRSAQESHMIKIMEKQSELTKILMKQQLLSTLPQGSIPLFDGQVLEYKSFIHSFENMVESKTDNNKDRLQFLIQYTRGPAQRLVKSCEYLSQDRGYQRAKELLKENFGNEYKISCAYLEKALSWSQIKSEDCKSLQDYAMFLRSCCNAMEEMEYMEELDTISNMRSIVLKLPYKLRERWRNKAYELQEQRSRRVRILDLVCFIEKQARIAADPVFGDLQDQSASRGKARSPVKSQVSKSSGSSFATSITIAQKQMKFDLSCPFCSARHTLDMCKDFLKITHRDKLSFLKTKGICFGCLSTGHISRDCKRRLSCKVCKQAHPSVLHIEAKDSIVEKAERPSNATGGASAGLCGHIGAGDQESVLSIVPVQVKAAKGSQILQVYALLDPGSSATFCSEDLMFRLNLKGRKAHILLRTMNQEKTVPTHVVSEVEVSALDSNNFLPLPDLFTQKEMPVTTNSIPKQKDLAQWKYLSRVKLPSINSKVELLIGTNAPKCLEPWEVVNSQNGGPYAVRTLLGWVVNGPLRSADGSAESVTVNRISVASLEQLLISQYNQDFSEVVSEEKTEMSVEDRRFLEIANEAVLQDGHYYLKLPFRKTDISMPNNRQVAEQRLQTLKRKMKKDEQYKQEYIAFINDIFENHYAEEVPEEELTQAPGKVWYIPHHGVYHPKKKKLRVVFDCAATYKGVSLNTELLQGPDLTNSLVGVIWRFRKEPIGIMADIKSMFHQVGVEKSGVDYLRFLWWPQGDTSQTPKEYHMLVHIFGAVSSPSCASFALQKTADDNESCFPLHVAETIRHNFYVDDCAKSMAEESEAIQLVKDLTTLCYKGGFQLTQWVSNNRAVLASIPKEKWAKEIKTLDLDKDSLPIERALGLQWCVDSDHFQFNINLSQRPHTRRGILSVVSSIFDPLGFLAPLILPAKQLLQELCKRGFGWDEPLPQAVVDRWEEWTNNLERIKGFSVARCLKPKGYGTTKCAELHHFADASENGYGSASYIRQANEQDIIHVTFLMGKSRVLPLKSITVPRLELAAAALLVKVDKMLRRELHLPLKPSVFWTDSQTVLKYIRSDTARFKTYVANRVSLIRDNSELSQWRYVRSKDNPADDSSRGLSAGKFMEQRRWMHGPEFLWKPEEGWLEVKALGSVLQDDPEVRRNTTVFTTVVNTESPTDQLISYFSNWIRLLKAVAWYIKLKKALRLRIKKQKGSPSYRVVTRSHSQRASPKLEVSRTKPGGQLLTVEDLLEAERSVIFYVQRQAFPAEISTLQMTPPKVKRSSRICRLDPVLDEGILRIGGRMHKSAMPDETKHPCILPKDSHISILLLRHIHERCGHSGRNHMLSELRKKYWINKANSLARKVLSRCVMCRRLKGKAGEQKMADLPVERILPDLPPFTNVGLDYFGPIEVKRGRSTIKRYGVLFTCMSSRAVHLEVAFSLDTDSCIHALRRFVCRRGQVKHIRSDNGTNLVGAQVELKKALMMLDKSKIQDALLPDGIEWSFNPPAASHHGGVWERLIRSVRYVLNSTLHQQSIDDEGLQTLFCEVEAILNNRPLSTVSSDPYDLEPLTPNHILLLKTQPIMPPGIFLNSDLYARRRWKQVQYMADLFWHRWTKEYLLLLQERQKWTVVKKNLNVGDLVLVVDPTAPRGSWPLGRVLETKPDRKGLVRSVKLQTQTSILDRPITKLCRILETEECPAPPKDHQ